MRYIYSIKQKIIEKELNKNSSEQCIYMFHEVNNETALWDDPNCAITEKSFITLIGNLVNNALTTKKGPLFLPQLTFDDGYEDVYTKVYPIMERFGCAFIVFVVSDFIGKERYLSKEQLVELSNNPLCKIGCHTCSHKMLRFCNEEEARMQIAENKAVLEDLTGKRIDYFAYPYGSIYACSKRDIGIVSESGFKYAFSTMQAPLPYDIEKMKFFLPRKNVCEANYKRYLK